MSLRNRPAPLGILGGTFDPIHYAHLRLAVEARQRLQLAKVRLIPAGQPPHREQPGSSSDHRLAMTRLAAREEEALEVDDAEVVSAQPSYTVLSLERLRGELGSERPLVLIMGADAFLGLSRWHRWLELFELAHIAVATRPNYSLDDDLGGALAEHYRLRANSSHQALRDAPAGAIVRFDMTSLSISATAIRNELYHGGNPRFLLPDAVLNYIQEHRLYQRPQPN